MPKPHEFPSVALTARLHSQSQERTESYTWVFSRLQGARFVPALGRREPDPYSRGAQQPGGSLHQHSLLLCGLTESRPSPPHAVTAGGHPRSTWRSSTGTVPDAEDPAGREAPARGPQPPRRRLQSQHGRRYESSSSQHLTAPHRPPRAQARGKKALNASARGGASLRALRPRAQGGAHSAQPRPATARRQALSSTAG